MRRRRAPSFRRLAAAACASLALLPALACDSRPDPEADADWPAGALVTADRGALGRLLARGKELEGTPLAREAARLASRLDGLPPCDTVEGRAADGSLGEALAALRCRTADSALAALDRERGARALAFTVPVGEDGGRAVGTLDLTPDGDLDLALRLPPAPFHDARALLLPGREAPGPHVLSDADAILHARLRPEGGIDLASLVPASGQGQQLFRLKSGLFSGLVLDGSWETAIYAPEPGARMPRVALALGVSQRAAAVAAIESYLRELQATWPVARSRFEADGAVGACLLDLKVLPEFAPCYAASEGALVIGWNPASLRKALEGNPDTQPGTQSDTQSDTRSGGSLVLDLERMRAADELLAHTLGVAARPSQGPPWQRLVAVGRREADGVSLRFELRGGSGA